MALTAPNREKDWSVPATRGDLFRVEGNLEGRIKDLRVEMADMDRGLRGEMADLDRRLSGETAGLRVEMADMDRGLRGEIAEMDRRLSGEIAEVRVAVAGLKVFIVWMVVGVITVLGGLVTVFEFVS